MADQQLVVVVPDEEAILAFDLRRQSRRRRFKLSIVMQHRLRPIPRAENDDDRNGDDDEDDDGRTLHEAPKSGRTHRNSTIQMLASLVGKKKYFMLRLVFLMFEEKETWDLAAKVRSFLFQLVH